MRLVNGAPHFLLVSSAILAMVLLTSHYVDVCILCRAESDFVFETLAAFTAVTIHLVVDKNLMRVERLLRRLRRPK
jgi:hypothetical protein